MQKTLGSKPRKAPEFPQGRIDVYISFSFRSRFDNTRYFLVSKGQGEGHTLILG